MESQEKPANKTRRYIIIAAFAVLAVALVVCIVLLFAKGKEENADQGEDRNAVMDRGFVNESNNQVIMDDVQDKVAEGMFECRMTTSWVFEDGESESPNAYVANVESNLHTIYFDVYDRTTEELLYSSPMIPVGSELESFKLDKKLQKGEYDATVMYTLVDEDYEEVSKVGFNITITVNH